MNERAGMSDMTTGKAMKEGRHLSLPPSIKTLAAIALVGMLFASSASCEQPAVTAELNRVLTPLVSELDLDAGLIEFDQARGVYAVEIEIDPGIRKDGWVLYMRSDQIRFSPDGAGKPCSDLMWKLDEEDSQGYRRLSDHEAVVLENPEGGKARIMLDILIALDWRTDPGTYGIGLHFRTTFL